MTCRVQAPPRSYACVGEGTTLSFKVKPTTEGLQKAIEKIASLLNLLRPHQFPVSVTLARGNESRCGDVEDKDTLWSQLREAANSAVSEKQKLKVFVYLPKHLH